MTAASRVETWETFDDDDGARGHSAGTDVEAEAGDGLRRDSGMTELGDGLVGGGERDHATSGRLAGRDRSCHRGGLAVAGGREHRPQRRPRAAQRPDGVSLILTE